MGKKQIRKDYLKSKEQNKEKLLQQGIPENKFYALESINKCEYVNKKEGKKDKNSVFGWDVFNTDAYFRAYKKRLRNMPFDNELYKDQLENPEKVLEITNERKHLLNADIILQQEKRKKFSRRRAVVDDQDVDYINDRNANFNKKLKRYFEKDAAEIKANLERGTAL